MQSLDLLRILNDPSLRRSPASSTPSGVGSADSETTTIDSDDGGLDFESIDLVKLNDATSIADQQRRQQDEGGHRYESVEEYIDVYLRGRQEARPPFHRCGERKQPLLSPQFVLPRLSG